MRRVWERLFSRMVDTKMYLDRRCYFVDACVMFALLLSCVPWARRFALCNGCCKALGPVVATGANLAV